MSIKRFRGHEEIEYKYFYSNGQEALPEESLDELSEDVLIERFVTLLFKSSHF